MVRQSKFLSRHMVALYEMELQIKDAASLATLLARKYKLVDTTEQLPLLQRFDIGQGEDIEGIQMDSVESRYGMVNMVLIANERLKGSSIRDDLALAISPAASSSREVEQYIPCELLHFSQSFGVPPRAPVGASVNLIQDLVSQLARNGHPFPPELVNFDRLLRVPETSAESWGQAS